MGGSPATQAVGQVNNKAWCSNLLSHGFYFQLTGGSSYSVNVDEESLALDGVAARALVLPVACVELLQGHCLAGPKDAVLVCTMQAYMQALCGG
jgi:hypothetical protein